MAVFEQTHSGRSELVQSLIEKHLKPRDHYIYGFADLTGLVDRQFGDFRYGISIGKKLDDGIIDSIKNGPTPEYYAHYKETNDALARLSNRIASELNRNRIETLCMEPTIPEDYPDAYYQETLRSRLSHKMVATRAGLGWIGKTALVITRPFGPRLRLVTILTKTPLRNDSDPVDKSRCGKCVICVEACPAEAATGQLWDITLDRDQFFDAEKCRAQCKEFGYNMLGGDRRICGICVSVCPIGNRVTNHNST